MSTATAAGSTQRARFDQAFDPSVEEGLERGAERRHPEVLPRRRRRAILLAVAAATVVLAVAAVRAQALSEQLQVDRTNAEIAQIEQANQHLEVEVAKLDAPARIVARAKADGMVVPSHVTYVFPPGEKAPSGGALERVGQEPQAALDRARSLVK